jgi:hypothetical protein
MITTGGAQAAMGIVDKANLGVDQEFGDMVTRDKSKAFMGQMDSASFATLIDHPTGREDKETGPTKG